MRELSSKVNLARRLQPTYIELRIDHIDGITRPEVQDKLIRVIRGDIEILTVRRRSEGGKFSGSESERISLISKLIARAEPRFVDVECRTLLSHADKFETIMLNSRTTRLIASYHSFNNCPSTSKLWSQVKAIEKRFLNWLFAVKIVCMARQFGDNERILSLYQNKSKTFLIAFCMGSLGIFSRVACVRLGSPLTYSSLPGEAVAPGQLDAISMNQLLSGM